jgi:hypothetical protein
LRQIGDIEKYRTRWRLRSRTFLGRHNAKLNLPSSESKSSPGQEKPSASAPSEYSQDRNQHSGSQNGAAAPRHQTRPPKGVPGSPRGSGAWHQQAYPGAAAPRLETVPIATQEAVDRLFSGIITEISTEISYQIVVAAAAAPTATTTTTSPT